MIARSDLFEILNRIDSELIGTAVILTVIGIFITSIVAVVSICRTINNIKTTRMTQEMVSSLLGQGYSIDEIERLVFGGQQWHRRVRRFVQSTRDHLTGARRKSGCRNHPVPPMKQTA